MTRAEVTVQGKVRQLGTTWRSAQTPPLRKRKRSYLFNKHSRDAGCSYPRFASLLRTTLHAQRIVASPRELVLDLVDARGDTFMQFEELFGVSDDRLNLGQRQNGKERQRLEVHLLPTGNEGQSLGHGDGWAIFGRRWREARLQVGPGAKPLAKLRSKRGRSDQTNLDEDAQMFEISTLRFDELEQGVVPVVVEDGFFRRHRFLAGDVLEVAIGDEQLFVVY